MEVCPYCGTTEGLRVRCDGGMWAFGYQVREPEYICEACFTPAKVLDGGSVQGPRCCGQPMADDGGCSEGCCDDYRCTVCGYKVRIEWPD